MGFIEFASHHGLIIENVVLDRWTRVPTEDKPHKKNGSYIFDGYGGAVQNWAVHEKPILFNERNPFKVVDMAKVRKDQEDLNGKAREKARFMVDNAKISKHPYLARKGFSELGSLVWNSLLLVPMYKNGLVGCQMIDPEGEKKFLKGQRSKGASHTLGSGGRDILVEGYATGLSVHKVLTEADVEHTIHICFSAGNMLEIAKDKRNPLVIADHDKVGIRTAQSIGQYWLSNKDGEDFNDALKRGYIGNIIELSKTLDGKLNR